MADQKDTKQEVPITGLKCKACEREWGYEDPIDLNLQSTHYCPEPRIVEFVCKDCQEVQTRTISFHCEDGNVYMYDKEADEILWTMDLMDSREVEDKLYELLTIATGAKRRYSLIIPEHLERRLA